MWTLLRCQGLDITELDHYGIVKACTEIQYANDTMSKYQTPIRYLVIKIQIANVKTSLLQLFKSMFVFTNNDKALQ